MAPNAATKRKQPAEPHNGSDSIRAAKRVKISTIANVSAKRKQTFESQNGPEAKHAAKRVKTVDARSILAQSSDKALNKNGELDVSAFVKARDFEIKAVENTMSKAKDVLSTRAFQQVPRELRRRTASHNVKRVPKRLRARAAKEVCYSEQSML